MRDLTKAEEHVMQILWEKGESIVRDIVDQFPDPKPAYNTVSTIVRILESKGFVDYEKEGKGHTYYPIVAREAYSNQSINKLLDSYFQGSFKSMVSFFVQKNDVDVKDIETLLNEIDKKN